VTEIRRYVTRTGKDVFGDWLSRLADAQAKARILVRIDRLAVGNFGDSKQLRGGISELRIDWGPGIPGLLRIAGENMRAVAVRRRQAQTVFGHSMGNRISAGQSGKDANKMKRQASISHDEALVRQLREDPDFAAEYLRAALDDADEPRVLLIALRRVAEARGGIAKVAKAAGVERESLYRALSPKGNPRLSTLAAVAKAMGLKLTVEAA